MDQDPSPMVQARAVSVIPNFIIREHPRDNLEQTPHYWIGKLRPGLKILSQDYITNQGHMAPWKAGSGLLVQPSLHFSLHCLYLPLYTATRGHLGTSILH